ncbi:MAG TPA: pyruvate kinase, partial [Mycobacteriales bacterium]|nr:pyruvate kinase [Mycobacteriales bacterium]
VTRRVKIVCTMGPATATPERMRGLVEAGMDVARLNFSHGSRDEHERVYAMVREASDRTGRAVGVLADLQGPKIRLGRFAAGPVRWRAGERVTITTEPMTGNHDRVSTTYARLSDDVRPGDRLLIDDGNLALAVIEVDGPEVRCDVVEGGPVSDGKGLSLPGVAVSVPALSDKDADDLRFALGLRVDLVALSFVRSPADAALVHAVMAERDCRLPVLAKLEKPQAVDALDGVVDAFDGLMVARGDLGVEMPLERVPLVQKRAVQACRERAKPVIVATQMLESMIEHSRPTRAEASDVANAVLDGADALMLSGETSVGRYPVQAVATMARIIDSVESDDGTSVPPLQHEPRTQGGAIAKAATEIGARLGAFALVSFTQTGDTVRRLARHHSRIPLLAFTPEPSVRSQLSLTWGVETFITPTVQHTDDMVRAVDAAMLENGRGRPGELVIIVAGSPPSTPGSTNLLRVHRLGDRNDRG